MRDYLNLNCLTPDEIEELDIFNSHNTHDNESSWNYNCMGYAFHSYGWLLPFDGSYDTTDEVITELGINEKLNEEEKRELTNELYHDIYNNSILIQLAIKRMLNFFSELRLINSFNELKDDEYGIVYACCSEDFHFGVYENGSYSHKMGGEPIRIVDNEDDIFYNRYDSERIYFAMKKDFKTINCQNTIVRI